MHSNPNYVDINVVSEEQRENSVLRFYRTLTALRKTHPVMVYGSYRQILEEDEDLIIYQRAYEGEKWLIICNFYGKHLDMPKDVQTLLAQESGMLLLGNYGDAKEQEAQIRPYEARIYQLSETVEKK